MITTGYCQSVGYTKMDSGSREFLIRQLWTNLTKYPQTADTTRAVLRVCFGRT
jgi:hypothetical protein